MDPEGRLNLCNRLIDQYNIMFKSVDNLHNNPPSGYSYFMYKSFTSAIEQSSKELSKTISSVCGANKV